MDESEWRFDKEFFLICLLVYPEKLTVGLHVLVRLSLLLGLIRGLLILLNLDHLLVLVLLWNSLIHRDFLPFFLI